jgi:hypothetical protein
MSTDATIDDPNIRIGAGFHPETFLANSSKFEKLREQEPKSSMMSPVGI